MMMIRALSTFLLLVSFGLVSCASFNPGYSIEGEDVIAFRPPEESGANYVDTNGWRLEGGVLNVTRDQTKHRVLRAGAQGGAILTSTVVPLHSQVATTGRAQSIYYDAFQGGFELVGDPIVEQGAKVTRKFGPDARLFMYRDGKIRVVTHSSLVPSS